MTAARLVLVLVSATAGSPSTSPRKNLCPLVDAAHHYVPVRTSEGPRPEDVGLDFVLTVMFARDDGQTQLAGGRPGVIVAQGKWRALGGTGSGLRPVRLPQHRRGNVEVPFQDTMSGPAGLRALPGATVKPPRWG